MAKSNTAMIGVAVVALGGVAWWYLAAQKDKTPVGLVVTNTVESMMNPLGENSDGNTLTANAVEGTWRADEDSLSVASESADKPLMVIYEDGTPIHAEVVTLMDYVVDNSDYTPEECEADPNTEECGTAMTKIYNDAMEKWKALAKDAGATEESLESLFVSQEESTTQEAESIFGPMLSLQSHFVW